jgi:hypothetical protein
MATTGSHEREHRKGLASSRKFTTATGDFGIEGSEERCDRRRRAKSAIDSRTISLPNNPIPNFPLKFHQAGHPPEPSFAFANSLGKLT